MSESLKRYATQTRFVSAKTPRPTRETRALPSHLSDPSFHLFVRYEATLLDVALGFTHGGEKCNFIGSVTKIDVVWQPVNRLEDLLFNAHGQTVTGTESNLQR